MTSGAYLSSPSSGQRAEGQIGGARGHDGGIRGQERAQGAVAVWRVVELVIRAPWFAGDEEAAVERLGRRLPSMFLHCKRMGERGICIRGLRED